LIAVCAGLLRSPRRRILLNTQSVRTETFGKLFCRPVDGYSFAQPLVMHDVPMPGGPRNVVFVATMYNTVYAYDADDPRASTPLWATNLGPSVPTADYAFLALWQQRHR
jgi:hypothetical protein